MSEEANRMEPSQSWEQEITTDHCPPLSNTNPTKPTNDIVLDYIYRMEYNRSTKTKRRRDFHAWLFLLTTLVATISYTAGLDPPGGFWSADDQAKGYIPGTSIMRAMFPRRYQIFYYSNAAAFFSSLMIIGMLAVDGRGTNIMHHRQLKMKSLIGISFVSVGASYISGTWESTAQGIYVIVLFVSVTIYFSLIFVVFVWNKATDKEHQQNVATGAASEPKHIGESVC